MGSNMSVEMQRRTTVLVVDEEQAVLDELAEVLAEAGFLCRCCSTTADALHQARQGELDLIISNIHLQGHSGMELCDRIRQTRSGKPIPLMFLSGAQIPDIILRRGSAGGSYYLRKPFDSGVLVELVRKAVAPPHQLATH